MTRKEIEKTIILLWLTAAQPFLLESCQKIDLHIKPDQVAYFEYEYINCAWGYQHAGWLINNSGKIHGYNLPDAWTLPDSAGYISETDLELNLSQTDTIYNHKIDPPKLNQQINLIPGAAKGRLSERKQVGYDGGIGGFYCYEWDSHKNKYKKVLLEEKGDLEQTNLSAKAQNLTSWLKQISKEL